MLCVQKKKKKKNPADFVGSLHRSACGTRPASAEVGRQANSPATPTTAESAALWSSTFHRKHAPAASASLRARNPQQELPRTRRQDIRNGDPLTQCSDLQHHDDLYGRGSLEEKTIYGVENSSTFLECSPKSQRALIYWQFQRPNEERKHEIKSEEHFIRTDQGLLIRSLHRKDSGTYYCHAVEHGFVQTLLRVSLEVIGTERLEDLLHRDAGGAGSKEPPGHLPSRKMWYRDFMSLISHPNLNSVEEFCEQAWRRERKQRRQKVQSSQPQPSKWKHLQENKKGRNRRTHGLERPPRSV
ncbi:semaphorin-3A-like [Arapaima gigas]